MEPESNQNEGINLLSLDGGGVRGVSSLVILDNIMMKIQEIYSLPEIPKPCEFFHMIAGTSTGGLIAIMLGRLRMSTKEALQEYDNCAAKIFSSENKKRYSLSEKFRATALEEVVQNIVEKRGMGQYMRDLERNHDKGKAIVCVMPSDCVGEPRLVRSFNDDGDDLGSITPIWQAARATTAASSFFKPQVLGRGPTAQAYVDAAIGVNNPVEYLLKEAVDEFGSGRRLGCVVSIGTGTRDVKLVTALRGFRNWLHAPAYYVRLINTLKITATDGEETHRRLRNRVLRFPSAYYRFNVPEAAQDIKLHHYQKIPELKSLTTKYLAGDEVKRQIQQVAEGLKTDGFDHGVTLGHIAGIDEEHVPLVNKKAQSMGITSRFFTGRQDILQRLDSIFPPRNTGGKPRREVLLHGMGGVGKSEIALKFAEDYEDRFPYIFYIDGSSLVTILQSYADIARRYNLGKGSSEVLRTQAMQWMEGLTEEWLMIFDDCHLQNRRGQLPGRGKGNVIYTSRSTDLARSLPVDCVFEVTPFGEADAVNLLLNASGSQDTSDGSEDSALAEAIVRELGYLPLAVDKAAASIRDSETSLERYLERLRDEKVRILSDARFQNKDVENPTVYATLELSYDALTARKRRGGRSEAGRGAAAALAILSLLSFYHHSGIPIGIFSRAARERHDCGSEITYPLARIMDPPNKILDYMVLADEDGNWLNFTFRKGVLLLQSFSLVKLSADKRSISMHVLVHTWARHRMEQEMSSRWAQVASALLIESIILSEKVYDKTFARGLRPHFDILLSEKVVPPRNEKYDAILSRKLGLYHSFEKQFAEARECMSRSIRIFRMTEGNESWAVINTLMSSARMHHEMGCLAEAELLYLEVLGRTRARLKYEPVGQPEEHGPLRRFSRALTKHVLKSHILPSNGFLKRVSDRSPTRSEKGKEVERPSEPDTAHKQPAEKTTSLHPYDDDPLEIYLTQQVVCAELGLVYADQGSPQRGGEMLCDAVENLEKYMDKNNPVLMKFQIQVRILTHSGNWRFWHELAREIIDGPDELSDFFMENDGMVDLLTAWYMSIWKHDPENWKVAHDLFLNVAYPIVRDYNGYYDKKTLRILRIMARCLMSGKLYDEAIKLARDCLARAKYAYGDYHTETIQTLRLLADAIFLQKWETEEEGIAVIQEALDAAKIGLGSTHPRTVKMQELLERKAAMVEKSKWTNLDFEDNPGFYHAWEDKGSRAIVEELWQPYRDGLEARRAKWGPRSAMTRRWEAFVGDRPPASGDEFLERLRAWCGPNHSFTTRIERGFEMRKAFLAQRGGEDERSGTSGDVASGSGASDGITGSEACDGNKEKDGSGTKDKKRQCGTLEPISEMENAAVGDVEGSKVTSEGAAVEEKLGDKES